MSGTKKLFENIQANLKEDDKKMLSGDETYVSKNQFNFSILGLIINNETKQFQFVNGQTMPLNKHKKLTSKALRQKARELKDQGYEEYKGYGSISLDESNLNESGANLDIDLNTGVLPIINVDMYSLSDRLPDSASLEELDKIIEDIAPKYIEKTIQEVLPSAKIIANKVYHPSQYNYSGDELEFNLEVNQDEYENLRKEALSNSEFENFLKSNYSSSSGFISSMPNNIEDFNRSKTWQSMVQVIMFALRNTDLDSVNDNYLDEFLEEVNQNFDFEEYDESALNEEADYNNYVYQLVGGDYAGTYTREEAEKLPIKEDKLSPDNSKYRNNGGVVPREELDNQLQFKGYLGPMYNGTDKDGKHIIRYETQEVYDMLSESVSNKTRKDYAETIKKELEKVQDSIANSDPNKNISGLESKRDFLMDKLSQLEESSLENVRKDSIEKGLLTEEYNPLNIELFMNTWGNYNENGADVEQINGGWMKLEQAKEFLEAHKDEEPFINDTEGDIPFTIDEYSNPWVVIEQLEKIEELSEDERAAFTAIMEDQNDDFDTCMDILESGDYIFFPGVETEEELGEAWVDMIGGFEGVANKENYIDEKAYRESWREAAEESVRDDNPDIDEGSDEFYDLVEEWLDSVVEEQLEIDIADGNDLSDYFDYGALGRDLDFSGFYFASTGAIQVL